METLIDGYNLLMKVGRLAERVRDGELSRARLYLSASLSDSTSVSLLEAMALGAYPVLSDIPANREWIAAPPGAQYFAPGNPAELTESLDAAAALAPAILRDALEENWRRVLEDAIWEDNMARVRAAFLDLVERRR